MVIDLDREAVEGLRLGTVLMIVAATLTLGLLVFWFARLYAGEFYNDAASETVTMQTLGLDSLSVSGISDLPVASVYTIVAREWRAVYAVTVVNKAGAVITSGVTDGRVFNLTVPVTKAGVSITKLTTPEQLLYITEGGVYSSRISGRAYVTVTQDSNTKAYTIELKLQQ